MKHVMCDLETLGTVPGCSVLSIGCVEFFPELGRTGSEFYSIVNTTSCEEAFLETDASTVEWWGKQSPEAREVLDLCATGGPTLEEALNKHNAWLQSLAPAKEILFYGNGADFDNPILRVAYAAAKVKPYAGGYGGRCYRTLKNLEELFGSEFRFHKIERGAGVHHNALDDAKAQAIHLMRNVARIRGNLFAA